VCLWSYPSGFDVLHVSLRGGHFDLWQPPLFLDLIKNSCGQLVVAQIGYPLNHCCAAISVRLCQINLSTWQHSISIFWRLLNKCCIGNESRQVSKVVSSLKWCTFQFTQNFWESGDMSLQITFSSTNHALPPSLPSFLPHHLNSYLTITHHGIRCSKILATSSIDLRQSFIIQLNLILVYFIIWEKNDSNFMMNQLCHRSWP